MPVAIVVTEDGSIPAILSEASDALLLARIASLNAAPALSDATTARKWLATLPEPSGWFESVEDARAYLAQIRRPSEMTGAELRSIRDAIGMSRADFGAAIGFSGNENTRHKQVFEMEKGAKPIMSDRARAARSLAAEHGLTELTHA